MKKSLSEDWNAVIVEPAVTSGSYICATYRFWAMFIKYVDFGWNYYLFGGDTNWLGSFMKIKLWYLSNELIIYFVPLAERIHHV